MPDENVRQGGRRRLGSTRLNGAAAGPTVSVVTAVFNARDCIAESIESVLQQDYPNVEYIIVDAASTDGTVEVLRRYEDRIDVWISEPDRGIYDAWNKGAALATGEWVAFLGADDAYLPDAIRKYMELAARDSNAEFLASRAQLVDPSGYAPVFGGPWNWPACARLMTTIHVGTLHRRSLLERYGPFDTRYRIAGDYEFLLRAGRELKAAFTPEVTVRQRSGGASDSTAGLYEARRAKIETGVRSVLMANWDLGLLVARFYVRRLLLAVFRKRVRSVRKILGYPTD